MRFPRGGMGWRVAMIILKGAGLIVCPKSLRRGRYKFQHYQDNTDPRPIIHAGDGLRPFFGYRWCQEEHAHYKPWGPY
jgi:hypothetical protein